MKTCSVCKKDKNESEFYSKQAKCKICHAKHSKIWAQNNKEKVSLWSRDYRQRNEERVKESKRIHYRMTKGK
jgi:cytochrome c553